MTQQEAMIKKVLDLREKRDQAIEDYNYARSVVQEFMKQKDLDMIDDGKYQFILEKRHKVDYNLLRDKYPEIYAKGMTYRFDDLKAREHFPRDIIIRALDECAEGVTEFVKIQRKPNKRKRK